MGSFLKMGYGALTQAQFGGNIGQNSALPAFPVNVAGPIPISLAAGEVFIIPSGEFIINPGKYTFLQWYDSNAQWWRSVQSDIGASGLISSDGANFRLANLTGTPVGAIVTTAGSYAVTPTVTPSAGASTWRCVMGGAVNTTVTITTAGSGYTLPPLLMIDPPPAGGIPASAICTISGGVINAVTVINQGGGYLVAPTIRVINAFGDTTGTGGVLTAALVGGLISTSNAEVVAVLMVTPGAAVTAVPTFTFSSGAAAATAIMCFTSTAVTSTGATNLANGSQVLLSSPLVAGSATRTNPDTQAGIFTPRIGYCNPATAAGAQVIIDGGLHQTVVQPMMLSNSNGTISAATTYGTNTVGGVSDTSYLQTY